MRPELRARIIAFNRARAKDAKASADFHRLLNVLPPGIVKQLLKDDTCRAILEEYGFSAG